MMNPSLLTYGILRGLFAPVSANFFRFAWEVQQTTSFPSFTYGILKGSFTSGGHGLGDKREAFGDKREQGC